MFSLQAIAQGLAGVVQAAADVIAGVTNTVQTISNDSNNILIGAYEVASQPLIHAFNAQTEANKVIGELGLSFAQSVLDGQDVWLKFSRGQSNARPSGKATTLLAPVVSTVDYAGTVLPAVNQVGLASALVKLQADKVIALKNAVKTQNVKKDNLVNSLITKSFALGYTPTQAFAEKLLSGDESRYAAYAEMALRGNITPTKFSAWSKLPEASQLSLFIDEQKEIRELTKPLIGAEWETLGLIGPIGAVGKAGKPIGKAVIKAIPESEVRNFVNLAASQHGIDEMVAMLLTRKTYVKQLFSEMSQQDVIFMLSRIRLDKRGEIILVDLAKLLGRKFWLSVEPFESVIKEIPLPALDEAAAKIAKNYKSPVAANIAKEYIANATAWLRNKARRSETYARNIFAITEIPVAIFMAFFVSQQLKESFGLDLGNVSYRLDSLRREIKNSGYDLNSAIERQDKETATKVVESMEETAKMLRTEFENKKGILAGAGLDELYEIIVVAAEQDAELARNKLVALTESLPMGNAFFNANEPSIRFVIDGLPKTGITPWTVKDLPAGNYKAHTVSENYVQDEKEFHVFKGETTLVLFEVHFPNEFESLGESTLNVNARTGSTVELVDFGFQDMTKRPWKFSSGNYRIIVKKNGFEDYAEDFFLRAGEAKIVYATSSQKPTPLDERLDVATVTFSADIGFYLTVDGIGTGYKSPVHVQYLELGTHKVSAITSGFDKQEFNLPIENNTARQIEFDFVESPPMILESEKTTLTIESLPKANILFPELFEGETTPITKEVDSGNYNVVLYAEGFKEKRVNIFIRPHEHAVIAVILDEIISEIEDKQMPWEIYVRTIELLQKYDRSNEEEIELMQYSKDFVSEFARLSEIYKPLLPPDEGYAKFKVSVSSTPSGGKILVNGVFTGEWTPGNVILYKGIYLIGVDKTGFEVAEKEVDVK